MEDIYFANPEYLWLLILIPLLCLWHLYNKGKVKAKLRIPTLKAFESVPFLFQKGEGYTGKNDRHLLEKYILWDPLKNGNRGYGLITKERTLCRLP